MPKLKHYCRRCHEFDDDGSLKERLDRYILAMDPEIKCNEEEYSARLMVCDTCDKLVNGMCGYCGCFVILRGLKKHMKCPSPSGDKWRSR